MGGPVVLRPMLLRFGFGHLSHQLVSGTISVTNKDEISLRVTTNRSWFIANFIGLFLESALCQLLQEIFVTVQGEQAPVRRGFVRT